MRLMEGAFQSKGFEGAAKGQRVTKVLRKFRENVTKFRIIQSNRTRQSLPDRLSEQPKSTFQLDA